MYVDKKMPKTANYFVCETCNFRCSKNSNYKAHILTRKHKILTNVDIKNAKNADKFICNCGKEYNHHQSLSLHKKKCKLVKTENNEINYMLVEQNKQ